MRKSIIAMIKYLMFSVDKLMIVATLLMMLLSATAVGQEHMDNHSDVIVPSVLGHGYDFQHIKSEHGIQSTKSNAQNKQAPIMLLGKKQGDSLKLSTLPSKNTDTALLVRRLSSQWPHIKDQYLILGGAFASQLVTSQSSSDANVVPRIDLTRLELDAFSQINSDISWFASFRMDPSHAGDWTYEASDQSKLYVQSAFLSIGDLSKRPYYYAIGQQTLPFGLFNYHMVTSIWAGLSEMRGQSIVSSLHMSKGTGHVFIMPGQTTTAHGHRHMLWGSTLKIQHVDHINLEMQSGFISNIMESSIIQKHLTSPTVHQVPAYTASASLDYPHIGVQANWLSSMSTIEPIMSRRIAAMQWVLFGNRQIKDFGKVQLGIDYHRIWHGQYLNLPKHAVGIAVKSKVWPHTQQSIEFRKQWMDPSVANSISRYRVTTKLQVIF